MSLPSLALRPPAASRRCRSSLAAIVVYLASFGSQVLLSAPVTARMSVLPFALVQAVLIWLWIVLHARRLRDAGRPAGLAVGIAIVYALEVVLLVIMVWLMLRIRGWRRRRRRPRVPASCICSSSSIC